MKSETFTSEQLYRAENNTDFIFPGKANLSTQKLPSISKIKKPKLSLNLMVLLGTFLLMSVAAFLIFELQPEFYELNLSRMNSVWGLALIVFTTSLFVFKAVGN